MIGRFAFRRILLFAVLLLASAAAVWAHAAYRDTHAHLAYLTGWSLFALMLILTAYNARKKLPLLPLLKSRTWFQLHVYLGLFTGLAFILHASQRVPSGGFEILLSALFIGVTLSGIIGWWLSRVIPGRLTTAGGDVPFERIPVVRRELRLQAESIALQVIPQAGATTLADFYAQTLGDYFNAPPRYWANLINSTRGLTSLLTALSERKRFFTAIEKTHADQLATLVRQKAALDFQYASQLTLKGWLFVHIPLTYGLLVFSVAHIVIVYAFSGGAR